MHLEFLRLSRFGRFERFDVEFPPVGVCAFVGPNASGKTTIVSAIEAVAVGRQAVRFDATGSGPSRIELGIREDNETAVARVSIEVQQGKSPTFRTTTTGSNGVEHKHFFRLSELGRSTNPPRLVFRSGEGASALTVDELKVIHSALPVERLPLFVREELKRMARPDQFIASSAMRTLFGLLHELAVRKLQGGAVPLILDEPLALLDESVEEVLSELLFELGRTTQIIWLSCIRPQPAGHILSVEASGVPSTGVNVAGPSYRLLQRRRSASKPARQFMAGATIRSDEDRFLEFKEVHGSNPVRSIADVVDQYVVAYLNSSASAKGRMLWGVSDGGRVVGVELTKSQRDELRRVVVEKLHKITPTLAPSVYSIDLHPVASPSNDSERWIVEVVVPPSTETILYATGKQEVYIKTDSGKKKLSALEIQRELLQRTGWFS